MQDKNQRHPSVRSADSAVIKAVEHQAALEREAAQKEAAARVNPNRVNPDQQHANAQRPAPAARPVNQRPGAPVQRQAQPASKQQLPAMHYSSQNLNTRMPVPHRPAQTPSMARPVSGNMPARVEAPRHLATVDASNRKLDTVMEERPYEDEQDEGIVVANSENAEFDDSEDEAEVEKKAAKARKPKQKKERKNRYLPYLIILFFEIIFAAAALWAINTYNEDTDLIVRDNTIEAGTTANVDMYIQGQPKFPEYVSCNLDFSTINYNIPQTIRFTVRMYGTNFPCVLEIVDTTPPTAEAVPHSMYSVDAIPPVEECVINIYDLNETTLEWLEVPDISAGGNIIAKAVVTDSSGNQTIVEVPFTVTKDSEAPVIEGTKNLEAFVGDAIRYREEVTVTDDIDPNPVLEIDTSNVDLKTAGTYDVIYRAKDFSGNVSEVTIKLKLTKKPKTYVEPEKVYAEANKVLKKIIKPNMTDMEKALQITYWVRYNINYVGNADNSSWTRAAYDGLTKRSGNCYNFAMAAKALFDAAGIENMIINRDPYIYHPHYWNYILIDGQWYHCDSTPRIKYNSYFFMYTTKELKNFWHNGWNGYNFKESKYPASATKSVQSKINYSGHSVKK